MENMPKATHSGKWIIGNGVEIECYVMDNKERVLSLRGAAKSMGLVGGGGLALTRNLNSIRNYVNKSCLSICFSF